ncbi:RNA polymerase sigma-70 factor (ECF subfamily) [Granulicella aggregans]|uniref:RNA polymerase sigma-70 factor (ECF subfamily) n=1 Tax=Granulicella aggregans TaxID=474949 RepID=A0A7W7ZI84_9BACT|nr:sigma-70 family RNA polymerase sigma factor [Granulicella aggregans]MBB5060382.1 RNA polymerase sigma-70 factor (ECF subfamily) [Granulicella aggregans]
MAPSPGTTPSTTEPFGIEYLESLYRYALVLTRQRTEAEDLVQETYVRAIEAYRRLRDHSNIKGWLFTILRNLWFNELRRRRARPHFVEPDGDFPIVDGLPGNFPDVQVLLEEQENAIQIREAISKLPTEFQEILILREFEELSYQEIASVLDCPAGTVMSRLGRARSKLRVILSEVGSAAHPERRQV